MIINILFRFFWKLEHLSLQDCSERFLSFTSKWRNGMTPVGLSWQTVFAAIGVKYSSPPLIYPFSLDFVWKRWFILVSLSPSTTLNNIMWTGLSFSEIWSWFSEARLWWYVRRKGNYASGCHDYDYERFSVILRKRGRLVTSTSWMKKYGNIVS